MIDDLMRFNIRSKYFNEIRNDPITKNKLGRLKAYRLFTVKFIAVIHRECPLI